MRTLAHRGKLARYPMQPADGGWARPPADAVDPRDIQDDAHDVVWLTQHGWEVTYTEPLARDPCGGASSVPCVFGQREGIIPPKPQVRSQPKGGEGAKPNEVYTVKRSLIPHTTPVRLNFSCDITRGRHGPRISGRPPTRLPRTSPRRQVPAQSRRSGS